LGSECFRMADQMADRQTSRQRPGETVVIPLHLEAAVEDRFGWFKLQFVSAHRTVTAQLSDRFG
jgi:hypothetical protein